MKTKTKGKDPKTIKELKEWLDIDGNSHTKLASALGYTSSTTVNQWITRGRVPEHQRVRVLTYIRKGEVHA